MKTNTNGYRGYRFPPEIISHSVWLYHRFALSFRDVEELLAKRGSAPSPCSGFTPARPLLMQHEVDHPGREGPSI